MPVLWPGHRWEDYQVRLIDNTFTPLAPLGTTFKLRGIRSLYGQFKGELTFALDKRDAYSQFLLERQLHFIQVLRDGKEVFGGFQIKLDREDIIEDAEKWIEFAFLPLAFLLHWRVGVCNEDNKIDLNLVAAPLDDNFKYIVRRTLGALALLTPTTALSRVMTNFNVQADLGLGPVIAIDGTGQDIYEIIQQYAAAHKVDWDVRFDANFHPEFRTYYPRRGTDRTEGGPGPDSARCIFSDEQGNFVKQSYGQDTSDLKTVFYDRSTTIDVAAGPTRRGNWGLREGIIDSGQAHEMQVALNNADLKEWYKLEEFKESLDKQWQRHFWTGDDITWNSVRLGYGPHDDTVAMMEFEIDEAGFEELTPTFGKPEPDIRDNLRGGGRGKNRPGYTAPTIWHIFGDALTNLDPDATNAIGVVGDGVTTTSTENAATNRTVIAAIPGGTCLWVRDDLDSGAGVIFGLHTGVAAEPVMIGADNANLTATPWVGTSGGTKLDVRGLARVVRGLYANENSLALWGMDGGVPIVHIVDETAAVGGAGGGACRFDVWNAAVRHHMLDADITRASYVRGFWETHDAAGAIGHSLNAVTGATIFNEQGLNTGHVRIESVGNVNMVYVDALNNRVGILDGAPGHTFDVGGDINAIAGSGYMINDTAANRHVLIGDGTRGVFRALVAADLPAVSNIWTRAGTSVYTTTGGDDVVPNAGNGTLGLAGDPWDMLYAEDITLTDGGWIGIGVALERIVFDAAGDVAVMGANLGIGTLAPARTLDLTTAGQITFGDNVVPDSSQGIYWHAGATYSIIRKAGAWGQPLQLNWTTGIEYNVGGDNPGYFHAFYTEGTEKVRFHNDGGISTYLAGDIEAYDAGVNLMASIDGTTGLIDSVFGYTVGLAAANRHVLTGDGAKGVFRALVAADLGGHVHAVTWDNVATGAGTNHTHAITGDTGAGTNHSHPTSKTTQTGTYTTFGVVNPTGNPVRDSGGTIRWIRIADDAAGTNARWERMYIGTSPHRHAHGAGDHAFTYGATNGEAAHTHDEGTLVGANENAHTHLYNEPNTPTGGPA